MDRELFRKVITEAVASAVREGILNGLQPEDVSYVSHLAKHVQEGKLSEEEALAELKRYSEARGYATSDDELVAFPATEDEYGDAIGEMVDVTEKVKAALIEAGEPGLADAFVEIRVPRERPPANRDAAVAISAKGWFHWDGVHPYETGMIQRAIKLAAESEGIEWMP